MPESSNIPAEEKNRASYLNHEHYLRLINLVIVHEIGKGVYAGLEFPLEDGSHLKELRGSSNNYLEFENLIVRIGINKLENLEEILRAPYIKPRSVRIL